MTAAHALAGRAALMHLQSCWDWRELLRGATRLWRANAAILSAVAQACRLQALGALAAVLLRQTSRVGQLCRALLRWRAAVAEAVAALLVETGLRERAAARQAESTLRHELRQSNDDLARRHQPAAAEAQRQVLELQAALDAELAHSQATASQLVLTRMQLAEAQRGVPDGMLKRERFSAI
jgi:hypothetical protein